MCTFSKPSIYMQYAYRCFEASLYVAWHVRVRERRVFVRGSPDGRAMGVVPVDVGKGIKELTIW